MSNGLLGEKPSISAGINGGSKSSFDKLAEEEFADEKNIEDMAKEMDKQAEAETTGLYPDKPEEIVIPSESFLKPGRVTPTIIDPFDFLRRETYSRVLGPPFLQFEPTSEEYFGQFNLPFGLGRFGFFPWGIKVGLGSKQAPSGTSILSNPLETALAIGIAILKGLESERDRDPVEEFKKEFGE